MHFLRAYSSRESYPHKPRMNRFDAVKTFPNGFSRELLRVEALFKSDAHAKVANSAYRPSMRLFCGHTQGTGDAIGAGTVGAFFELLTAGDRATRDET